MSSRAPVFTRGFLFICCATLLFSSTQSLVLTAMPLFLTGMGFTSAFVGVFVGAFSMCALVARFPVGTAVDRLGSRVLGSGGAALLCAGCLLYALAPALSARVPFASAVPFLLPIGLLAHSLGFSTFGTSASSYVAYAAPSARRGEALGYYGVVTNIGVGLGAAVSLPIVSAWGFSALLGTAAVLAGLAAILASSLEDPQRQKSANDVRSRGFRLNRRVLIPASLGAAMLAGNGAAMAFVPLLGVERGVANPGIYFTAMSLTSIIFRSVAGRVADKYGRLASIVPGMLLGSTGLFLVAHASSTETLALAGIVFGMGFASADPALQAMAIDVARPDQRGSAMATYFAMIDVGISAGSVVSGRIVPVYGYGGVFVTASFAPLLGLAGFLGTARLHRLHSRDPQRR